MRHFERAAHGDILRVEQLERSGAGDVGMDRADTAQNHQRRSPFAHDLVGHGCAVEQLRFFGQNPVEVLDAPLAENPHLRTLADYAGTRLGVEPGGEFLKLADIGSEGLLHGFKLFARDMMAAGLQRPCHEGFAGFHAADA